MKENTLKFNFIIIITTLLNLTMLTVNDKHYFEQFMYNLGNG
jgi:hypothetical protein